MKENGEGKQEKEQRKKKWKEKGSLKLKHVGILNFKNCLPSVTANFSWYHRIKSHLNIEF